jgi:hypothetical protein
MTPYRQINLLPCVTKPTLLHKIKNFVIVQVLSMENLVVLNLWIDSYQCQLNFRNCAIQETKSVT